MFRTKKKRKILQKIKIKYKNISKKYKINNEEKNNIKYLSEAKKKRKNSPKSRQLIARNKSYKTSKLKRQNKNNIKLYLPFAGLI